MSTHVRRARAALVALVAAPVLALAAPLPASAHISFDDNTAEAGSSTLLTLRVPNESATVTTDRITLTLPTDTPFTNVRTVPVAGWTIELVRETLPEPVTVGDAQLTDAVVRVVWTADAGTGLGEQQLGLFPVSLGPVPDVGSIVLPVEQGYSDGTVVSWSDTGDDAAKPAPVLYVNDAPPAGEHGGGAPAVTSAPDAEASDGGQVDVFARVLAVVALAAGAAALVLALRRNRGADAAPAARTDAGGEA